MTIKDTSTIAGTWVAILSAIVGGYFAFNEFRAQGEEAKAQNQRRMDERTLQTFHMYEGFRNSDMLERRSWFDAMRSDDPGLDFWINYFDTVQACVENKLCDKELVDQLFKPYARASLDEVQCRIVDVRELEKSYGLPREQGYGLLMISGVEKPTCVREPLAAETAAKPPKKPAAVVDMAQPLPAAAPVNPGVAGPATPARGSGGASASAASEPTATSGIPARGRGSATTATGAAPATGTTERGRGN